jgi:SAM-dependent methyltransferase
VIRRRRSLTHVGGEVETSGNREVASALAHALDVAPPADAADRTVGRPGAHHSTDGEGLERAEDPDRVHVHGFHTYPARMHPATASRLVEAVTPADGKPGMRGTRATVLDPFCGSGTVLVEALIAGRAAIGTDLNPIAVRLARLKTSVFDAPSREALVAAAREVAAFADGRRERRAGATRRYPPEDVATFDPHVLLELDSLRAGIASLPAAVNVSEALELVLSAILVKVSRRTSDTSAAPTQRRIAAGFPARLFVRKTEELARRLEAFEALLRHGSDADRPPEPPPVRVALDDACKLRSVPASTVDGVVTSPPYVATYDYLAHHALRMRWLGLDASELAARELGSRRRYAPMSAREASAEWARELGRALTALSRVCKPGARVALVVADSAVRGEALRADDIVPNVAREANFAFVARASQRRPHFHAPSEQGRAFEAFGRKPRGEHAILLEKQTLRRVSP